MGKRGSMGSKNGCCGVRGVNCIKGATCADRMLFMFYVHHRADVHDRIDDLPGRQPRSGRLRSVVIVGRRRRLLRTGRLAFPAGLCQYLFMRFGAFPLCLRGHACRWPDVVGRAAITALFPLYADPVAIAFDLCVARASDAARTPEAARTSDTAHAPEAARASDAARTPEAARTSDAAHTPEAARASDAARTPEAARTSEAARLSAAGSRVWAVGGCCTVWPRAGSSPNRHAAFASGFAMPAAYPLVFARALPRWPVAVVHRRPGTWATSPPHSQGSAPLASRPWYSSPQSRGSRRFFWRAAAVRARALRASSDDRAIVAGKSSGSDSAQTFRARARVPRAAGLAR